jgi:hypothetical protein
MGDIETIEISNTLIKRLVNYNKEHETDLLNQFRALISPTATSAASKHEEQ